jgi:hypothetical protein
MNRYLILVSILMIATSITAMEDQPDQHLAPNPSQQNIRTRNASDAIADSCCCVAMKTCLEYVLCSPVFCMNYCTNRNANNNNNDNT